MKPFPRSETVPERWRRDPQPGATFVRSFTVPQSPERVADFFADAGHLEHIAPRWLSLHYISDRDTPIVPDATLDYRVRIGGVPFSWRTRIVDVQPGRSLAYEQERGPCVVWRHLYDYLPVEGGTQIVDSVLWSMPLGRTGRIGRRVLGDAIVRRMFDVRERKLRQLLANQDLSAP